MRCGTGRPEALVPQGLRGGPKQLVRFSPHQARCRWTGQKRPQRFQNCRCNRIFPRGSRTKKQNASNKKAKLLYRLISLRILVFKWDRQTDRHTGILVLSLCRYLETPLLRLFVHVHLEAVSTLNKTFYKKKSF